MFQRPFFFRRNFRRFNRRFVKKNQDGTEAKPDEKKPRRFRRRNFRRNNRKPAEEKPAEEKPAEEKPAEEKPAEVVEEKPATPAAL